MTTASNLIRAVYGLADVGRGEDVDGVWGSQCVDLINWPCKQFLNTVLWGNAIDLLDAAASKGWRVEYVGQGTLPRAGAAFVMATYEHPYGHTGWVIADSDGVTLRTVEQNVDGYSDTNGDGVNDQLQFGGPARYVTRAFSDGYGYVVGWFYPPYDQMDSSAMLQETSNPAGWRKLKDEAGTMTVQVAAVRVRNSPSVTGEVVATYGHGMSFAYDSVYLGDGYVWVSYVSHSGVRRYVACGKEEGGRNVAPFGSFA